MDPTPRANYTSIRTLVEAFDRHELHELLGDFTPRQRARLWFTRWLVHTGRLVENPANYWKRWEPQRDSLGSEWGSPIY